MLDSGCQLSFMHWTILIILCKVRLFEEVPIISNLAIGYVALHCKEPAKIINAASFPAL